MDMDRMFKAFLAACLLALAAPCAQCEQEPKRPANYVQTLPGGVTFEMVGIPAGQFLMGSPDSEKDRAKSEGPRFTVKVDAFWMGKHEATWGEFRQYFRLYSPMRMATVKAPPPKDDRDAISIPTLIYSEGWSCIAPMGLDARHPACGMTQFCAKQYTKWLSHKTGKFYRLPTEAEWEYACRAGTNSAYSFGDDPAKLGEHAWYFDNAELPSGGENGYRKPGLKKPNPWGLFDMHGNMAEWVIDQHEPTHYAKFAGKTVTWKEAINWPKQRYGRVVRGGSFEDDPKDCRSASRNFDNRDWQACDVNFPNSAWWNTNAFFAGFRVVRPIHEPDDHEKARFWEADCDDIKEAALKGDGNRGLRVDFKDLKGVEPEPMPRVDPPAKGK